MTDEERSLISQMSAVTVSREYGSGGGEVAARLARRLEWRLIDHDVVVRVAQELGVSEEEAQAHDEYAEGVLGRLLISMQRVDPALVAVSPTVIEHDPVAYTQALHRVISAAVRSGHVVIVGRGSQVYLAPRRDVFHLRVVAPLDLRVKYVMQREGLDEAAARTRIQLKERDRVRYLQTHHQAHPHDAHLYDLIVNTGVLDLDDVVDIALLALTRKAKPLGRAVEALGPGAGLAQYPGQPGDFRLPES